MALKLNKITLVLWTLLGWYAWVGNSVSLTRFVIWQKSRIKKKINNKVTASSLVIKCSNLERKRPAWRCFMVDQIWYSKFRNAWDTSPDWRGHVIRHGDDSEYAPRHHLTLQWELQQNTNFEEYWRLLQYGGIVDMSIPRNWQHGQLGSSITNMNHAGLLTSRPVLYHSPGTFIWFV